MKRLFGTDGIRGTAGAFPLDPKTVTRVGAALARTLAADRPEDGGTPRILVGRDTRESGDWIERSITAGAKRGGAECLAVGVIPTPGVAFLARSAGFSA